MRSLGQDYQARVAVVFRCKIANGSSSTPKRRGLPRRSSSSNSQLNGCGVGSRRARHSGDLLNQNADIPPRLRASMATHAKSLSAMANQQSTYIAISPTYTGEPSDRLLQPQIRSRRCVEARMEQARRQADRRGGILRAEASAKTARSCAGRKLQASDASSVLSPARARRAYGDGRCRNRHRPVERRSSAHRARPGLATWNDVRAFTEEEWFPSRIAFGKFKGRDFRDATDDQQLKSWLVWLSESSNQRSARMGKWYLSQLDAPSRTNKNRSTEHVFDRANVQTEKEAIRPPSSEVMSLFIEIPKSSAYRH